MLPSCQLHYCCAAVADGRRIRIISIKPLSTPIQRAAEHMPTDAPSRSLGDGRGALHGFHGVVFASMMVHRKIGALICAGPAARDEGKNHFSSVAGTRRKRHALPQGTLVGII